MNNNSTNTNALQMQAYLQSLVKSHLDKGLIKNYKVLKNGAIKVNYYHKAPSNKVNKALGTNLGNNLRAMTSVRVCQS